MRAPAWLRPHANSRQNSRLIRAPEMEMRVTPPGYTDYTSDSAPRRSEPRWALEQSRSRRLRMFGRFLRRRQHTSIRSRDSRDFEAGQRTAFGRQAVGVIEPDAQRMIFVVKLAI